MPTYKTCINQMNVLFSTLTKGQVKLVKNFALCKYLYNRLKKQQTFYQIYIKTCFNIYSEQ